MHWHRKLLINLIFWPACLLGVVLWFMATARLTMLTETLLCRSDPIISCIGTLGDEAEQWVFAGFGITIAITACWLGQRLLQGRSFLGLWP